MNHSSALANIIGFIIWITTIITKELFYGTVQTREKTQDENHRFNWLPTTRLVCIRFFYLKKKIEAFRKRN